jgi:hypothetical protein
MKTAVAMLLLAFPLLAGAQVSPPVNAPPAPAPPAPVQEPPEAAPEATPPPPPPPEVAPALPPSQLFAPPEPTAPPQSERASVPPIDGQWVYTAQYGWVWMPFAPQFIHVPPSGAPPQMFVFYPAFGWRWVVAPWVWGLGPQPYWGVHGFSHFGWWGRGFGRWYGFGPAYVGWGGRYYWSGGRWVAPRRIYPAPRVVARSPQRFPPHGWHRHRRWR